MDRAVCCTGFGAIGFYDDYLKVTTQTHDGFSGRARLALEAVIGVIACSAMVHFGTPNTTGLAVPLINGFIVDLGYFFLVFGPFVIVSAGNAVNLTDGLDGLAIVPVMIAAGTFAVIAYLTGNFIFASYLGINFVAGRRRTRGRLRRADRRRTGFPVVQRAAGADLHG